MYKNRYRLDDGRPIRQIKNGASIKEVLLLIFPRERKERRKKKQKSKKTKKGVEYFFRKKKDRKQWDRNNTNGQGAYLNTLKKGGQNFNK